MAFILSDESINSYGAVISTKGIDLSLFEKNPIMLWDHRRGETPIGRWDNIRIENDQLIADEVFDEDDKQSLKIKKKVDKKMINMASIGIEPIEVMPHPTLKDEFGNPVPLISKSLLFEASLTDVGGNSNAVRLFKDGKLLTLNKNSDLLNFSKHTNKHKMNYEEIALKLGLKKDASLADILSKIESNKVELSRAEKDYSDLLEKTNQEAQEAADKRAEELVELSFKAGKIGESEKSTYLTLAKADYDSTKKALEAKQSYKSLGDGLDGGKTKDKYADWGFQKLHREAPKELARIRKDEPERYQELFNAAYSK